VSDQFACLKMRELTPQTVSTTTKPVTVTADVAVKKASDQVMLSVEAAGNINSKAPTVIQLK